MFVIEQPIPPAPAADFAENVLADWNAVYDAHNEVACLMFGSMTPELHRQFENYAPYEMLQEEGKPVAAYVLKMKRYVDQLKRLGYVLPQDLTVGLILNGLTKDFAGFVRNHNMHNMEKTIGKLHTMLIEYEKGLPKKAETPQVTMIKSGKTRKPIRNRLNLKKKKQVGSASSSDIFTIELFAFPNKSWVYDTGCDNCHYAPSITRGVVSVHCLVENRSVQCFTDFGISISKNNVLYFNATPSNGLGCEALVKRDTPDKLQQKSVKCIFIGYPKKTMGYYFYILPENKIVVSRYAEFFEKNLITQEVSGRAINLEEIQDEDTSPFEITSKIPMDVEGFEPPQEEEILIRRFGEATFILGIKIYRDRSKRLIGLGQNAYMDKIIKRYRMDNSKRGHIRMQERLDLNKTQGASTAEEVNRMQNVPYASAVGSIMYAKSSKQSTTAMLATEDEYIAASEAAMKVVWISKFISGLGIVPTINQPIKMFSNNLAALHFANEPGVQKGARLYHRRYHYVCESIELGEIKFLKVHTDDNQANPFMKALPKGKLTQHARSMGLRLASSFM
nr:hypothetical protein [Tanacetum cinerariifolium]